MKKSILITGVPGSGKSSVCRELTDLDYAAYDIESIEGICKMVRKDTGENFVDFDNADLEKVKNSDWICDKDKLQELIRAQTEEIAFYCITTSNTEEIIPLFTDIILLRPSPETVRKRLSNREGKEDMGNVKETREWILSWKDWWENKMIEKGAVAIDANGTLKDIAQKILDVYV